MLEESSGEEDVAAEGVDPGPLTPWLVLGPRCLTCEGGLRTTLGGGFSKERIYFGIEDMAKVKMAKIIELTCKFSLSHFWLNTFSYFNRK